MSFALSKRSKQAHEGIDPRLIEIDNLAITLTLVDYGHGNDAGLRTADRQFELFNAGKSKVDGYDKRSRHQRNVATGYSEALDFYAFVDGHASWEYEHLVMVAAAFLQAASILGYQISWGGLWKSRTPKMINGIPYGWDCPHIQLEG